jgi:hypothetical protein
VRLRRRGSWKLMCSLFPKASPYIGGRGLGGAPYPLPKAALGRQPGEEQGWRWPRLVGPSRSPKP